ncbi:MAG TPA: hypothetical protein VH500_18065 [Nitrososphaeraceae archaeon]
MNYYNHDRDQDSSQDPDSVAKISDYDLLWLLNSAPTTAQILEWEMAQYYDIPIEEVEHQLDNFSNRK